MKKKLLFVLLIMVCCLAACGKKEEPKNETLGSIDESAVDIESTESGKDVTTEKDETVGDKTENTESVEKPVEDNVVVAVKEEDVYVDFDGVKLPIVITWEDFKEFMKENDWEFIDNEKKFPNEKTFTGNGRIGTNCGIVSFRFMENSDKTGSELRAVKFCTSDTHGKVSCCGISNKVKREDLDKTLELESESDTTITYYLDKYLYISLVDEYNGAYDITIKRELYPSRK